jgi:hypothetical protein
VNAPMGSGEVMARLIPPALPNRLTSRSRRNLYNVYEAFSWPERIDEKAFWMGPELLSVAGTEHAETLPSGTLKALSKWETINLFSVFTQGEGDLIQALIDRIHLPFLEDCFDYLVHFIDEENKHMWFFAEFCRRYGGKIYPQKKIKSDAFSSVAANDFLAFMRIVIFEEMGDWYNVRIMNDERVPHMVREIHRVHHQDEIGHLAIGRELSLALFEKMKAALPQEEVAQVAAYVEKYTVWTLRNIYHPGIYRDAGIPDAYRFRDALVRHAGRGAVEAAWLDRVGRKFEPVFRMRANAAPRAAR